MTCRTCPSDTKQNAHYCEKCGCLQLARFLRKIRLETREVVHLKDYK
jgi:hypothetical protein